MAQPRILLVEDESSIAEPFARLLAREGFVAAIAPTVASALEQFDRQTPDLVLLDLNLPDGDGRDVARELRARSRVPIIMLTARGTETDRVVGLEIGADDYVVKPFSAAEVIARIRAVLRRTADSAADGDAPSTAPLSIRDLRIDPAARRVVLAGDELDLSRKEYDLLLALADRAGTVVTREDLMAQVWDENWFGSTKTLDVHIGWLRRKLGDDAAHPRWIETVRGVGFRFAAPDGRFAVSLRRGLLLALAYVLVLAIVALLVPLGLSLRDRVDAEVKAQSRSQAEVVAARASPLIDPPRVADLRTLSERAARQVRGRVVIVGPTGALLADSSGVVRRGTSYASRPEISAALAGNVTQVRRGSQTLGEEILATAVPVLTGASKPAGAVRITQSVSAVNRAVRRTWLAIGLIGALVLALGLLAGAIIARQVARPILRLDDAAERVAGGDLTVRARIEGSTEQRKLARTFNQMTERLATLLVAQRDFVADASHQLRTPLAGLRLRLEEARAEATTPVQADDLDAALGEVDRLALIVNELLELSRAGEDGRVAATTDPAAAVDRAVRRFQAAAAAAGCRLQTTPAPEPGTLVVCHQSDLDRILDVLLENAIAYAPGAPIELSADGPLISVRDHGPGPGTDEQDAVFERFHRGHAARSSGVAGTGLGLAIARDLARRWGGEVTLVTAPGGGALAQVRLVAAGFADSSPGRG